MTRLFVPPGLWKADEFPLPESEARHAVQVLRLEPGDRVLIFDGTGRAAEAEIVTAGKRGASVRVVRERHVARPSPGIHLIMALIKGERFDWAVQKATELGAASIRPVVAERSVVRVEGKDAGKKHARWVQTAVEAAKQCGHLVLPEIFPIASAAEAFLDAPPGARGIPALHPDGVPFGNFLDRGGGDVTLAIGPEGDWTPEEMAEALNGGFVPLDLGAHVLRSETAALYVLSVAAHQRLGGAGGLKEKL